jgi:hypothetical protein
MGKEERHVIEPVALKSLLEILTALEPLNEDFPPILDPLAGPVDFQH